MYINYVFFWWFSSFLVKKRDLTERKNSPNLKMFDIFCILEAKWTVAFELFLLLLLILI